MKSAAKINPLWFLISIYFSLVLLCSLNAFAAGKTLTEKEFKLPAVNDSAKAIKFADLASQKLILIDFWASWCGPCKKALPHHAELQKKYKSKKLLVLAVSADDSAKDRDQFLKDHPIDLPVLWDQNQDWISLFDIEAIPTAILLDSKLNVLETFRGFSEEKMKRMDSSVEKHLN